MVKQCVGGWWCGGGRISDIHRVLHLVGLVCGIMLNFTGQKTSRLSLLCKVNRVSRMSFSNFPFVQLKSSRTEQKCRAADRCCTHVKRHPHIYRTFFDWASAHAYTTRNPLNEGRPTMYNPTILTLRNHRPLPVRGQCEGRTGRGWRESRYSESSTMRLKEEAYITEAKNIRLQRTSLPRNIIPSSA